MTQHTDYIIIFVFYEVQVAFMIFFIKKKFLKMRNNEKYSEKNNKNVSFFLEKLVKMKKKIR